MIPVVDVSEHQGVIDFKVMKSRGVVGTIIRATHGLSVDKRLMMNAYLACEVFGPENVGYYTFCNPKRGAPVQIADAFKAAVEKAHGSLNTFFMHDIEGYVNEPPNRGLVWPAAQYASWLHALADEFTGHRQVGYTNDSYFRNGVADKAFAARLEWIGARYPAYSHVEYDQHPLPLTAAGWEEWAFAEAKGPIMPAGSSLWQGWQFSAGYNRAGPYYGCQSGDLDLNIIRPEAWARWTGQTHTPPHIEIPPTIEPPTEDDGMDYITNASDCVDDVDHAQYGPKVIKWKIMPDGTILQVTQREGIGRNIGRPEVGVPMSADDISAWPRYSPVTAVAVAQALAGSIELSIGLTGTGSGTVRMDPV